MCIIFPTSAPVMFDIVHLLFCILQVGERIRVILDCDDNTLAFEKNYEFLGNLIAT